MRTNPLKESPVCRGYIRDGVLVAEFDNPPVNAIGQDVRTAVVDALEAARRHSVRAVLFCARGRTFFSGADIREFDQKQQKTDLPQTLDAMDRATVPLVALLHGTVLGGGLEFALRCDVRLAHPDCRFGFPEVKLGLIPGAGGTQLLPRLIDPDLAVGMICQGGMIDCASALERGLIDHILPIGEIEPAQWVDCALGQIDNGRVSLEKRRVRERRARAADEEQIRQWRESVRISARGQDSPLRALQAVIEGLSADIDTGLKGERKIFMECKNSAQSAALRHIFFAEKSSGKPRDKRGADAGAMPLTKCAVVGCGTMGAGIGGALLHTGAAIVLVDSSSAKLQAAHQSVLARLEKMRQRGQIDEARCQEMSGKIECEQEMDAVRGAQLVIEAVFEDKSVKQKVFAQIDRLVDSDTLLATNTSYIDPREIFAGISNPNRHIGLHFFSPADVMKLLEIVVLPQTDARALATATALARKMKKNVVLAQPEFGFVANRSYMAYGRAVQDLLLAGNTPEQIDEAMTGFGMAMGPLAVLDMSGIDIGHQGRMHNPDPPQDPAFFLPASVLVSRGELGRKTGVGFYRYQDGKKCGSNEEAMAVVVARARQLGIAHRPREASEIVAGVMTALAQEGQRLVDTGICQRAGDLDVVWVSGYGFPRWRGGPMYWFAHQNEDPAKQA